MRCWIISLAAAVALSCSVKEDRTGCACILVLDMTSCSDAPDNVRIDLRTSGGRIEQDFIPGRDSPLYEYPVPKGMCTLSAYICPRELSQETEAIVIDPGDNCPELFASVSSFEAAGETAQHRVVLHKQYAGVTLDLGDSSWQGSDCTVIAKGEVCGVSLADLRPLEGIYLYQVPAAGDGTRRFRLPRQTGAGAQALTLELQAPGAAPRTFDLGKYLQEAGYDWDAEDLQDITVKVRDSEILVEISSCDWTIQSRQTVVI